jgi:hypothetical protein
MLLRLFVAWVLGIAGLYVALTALEFPQRLRYLDLITDEATAPGVVTKCEPSNHYSFTATFSLAAGPVDSGGFIDDIGRCYAGKPVTVYYQAGDPTNNCVCNPQSFLADSWQAPVLVSLYVSWAPPLMYTAWLRRRQDPDDGSDSIASVGEPIVRARRTLSRPNPLMWLWSTGRVLYELPFPPDEVGRRLAGALLSRSETLTSRHNTDVILAGWAEQNRFQLVVRADFRLRTWFESILEGPIRAAGGGSLVVASFRLGGLLLASAATLLAYAVVITTWTVAASITHTPELPLAVLVPLLVGLGLFILGRMVGTAPDRSLLVALDRLFEVVSESPAQSRPTL